MKKLKIRQKRKNLEDSQGALISRCQLCLTKKEAAADGGEARVNVGMGEKSSPILVLTSQPRLTDAMENLPIGGKARDLYDQYFERIGMDSMKHVYLINIVRCAYPKVNKGITRNCLEHLEPFVLQEHVKVIVGLGPVVLKWFFGRGGRVPTFDVLAGRALTIMDYPGKQLFFLTNPQDVITMKAMDDALFLDNIKEVTKQIDSFQRFLLTQQEVKQWLISHGSTIHQK